MITDTHPPVAAGTARKRAKRTLATLSLLGVKQSSLVGLVIENREVVAIFVSSSLDARTHDAVLAMANSFKFSHSQTAALKWGMHYVYCTPTWAQRKVAEDKVCHPDAKWLQFVS